MTPPPLVEAADELLRFLRANDRPACLHDVQSVVSRMAASLDVGRVRLWGARFAEILEKPELLDPFEAALRKPGRFPPRPAGTS